MNGRWSLLNSSEPPSRQDYAWAAAVCGAIAAVAAPLVGRLDLANIVMLFLLGVLLIALKFGRGPAVLAAFLSVALFDFFFVPPQLSFTVNDAQYLVTFAVMLAVALITGQLTAGLRQQADVASLKEQRTQALYEMARDLAGALTLAQTAEILHRFLSEAFSLDVALLLPDDAGELRQMAGAGGHFLVDQRLALLAYDQGKPVEDFTLSGYGFGAGYFPLKAPMKVRGVIVYVPTHRNPQSLKEQRPLLTTISSLAGIAVERLHYMDVAQETQVQIVSERLRSSILSALSHDLRTPLTALVGLADSLTLARPPLGPEALETAEAIREQALRLSGLVGNLLDMARLHAGRVVLHKEWQLLEEVVGASIQLLGRSLAKHPVRVALPLDLPLVEFDAVLIERVLCNLLENAAKYAPPGTEIEVGGEMKDGRVAVSVCDHGSGFPADRRDAMFDMFVRGAAESATPGVGLGLTICRSIIEAHGGTITAFNRPEGGACVVFTLPGGTPPRVEMEGGT